MNLSPSAGGGCLPDQPASPEVSEEHKCLNSELWHACAGPLVSLQTAQESDRSAEQLMSTSTVSPTEYVPRHKFPVLDTDPHFKRVIKYMRSTDLAAWLGFTVGVPGLLYAWDLSNRIPVRHVKTQPRFYGLGTWLGFCGGFLMAYERGANRFLGWSENEREQKMQHEEFTQIARSGQPIWGESTIQPWIQTVAHHNSQFAHLKFSTIPWFNFVNHPYHGVDVSKYYEDAKVWRQESGLEN